MVSLWWTVMKECKYLHVDVAMPLVAIVYEHYWARNIISLSWSLQAIQSFYLTNIKHFISVVTTDPSSHKQGKWPVLNIYLTWMQCFLRIPQFRAVFYFVLPTVSPTVQRQRPILRTIVTAAPHVDAGSCCECQVYLSSNFSICSLQL